VGRRARDADRLLGLYSDDVVLLGYNKNSPPASPTKLEGKASIEPMLRDVFGREMTRELTAEVVGEGRLSYNEHCEYPDGNRVFASVVCDLRDGEDRPSGPAGNLGRIGSPPPSLLVERSE